MLQTLLYMNYFFAIFIVTVPRRADGIRMNRVPVNTICSARSGGKYMRNCIGSGAS